MVEPVSDQERSDFTKKVKAGFVLLVGLSGGLITLQTGAGPTAFLVAACLGIVAGVVLLRIAFPEQRDLERGDGNRSRRRW